MPDLGLGNPDAPLGARDLGVRDLGAADVAAFLRAHPGFLSENPELYRTLSPPLRVHGAALEDHMAAMLRAERAHATAMAERADDVLAAGRAAAGLAARVQEAVLALMRSQSIVESIAAELPVLLAIDAASLCVEADVSGMRRLPAGLVGVLLDGRSVVFRDGGEHAVMLHGEAARLALREALVRIPGCGPPALLALTSRDAAALDPVQGTGALAFLGRAIAAALNR